MLISKMHSDAERIQRLNITEVTKPISRRALRLAIAEALAGPSLAIRPGPSPIAAPPSNALSLSPLRILVAEDLEDNRDVLALFLKETPYRLEFAEDGAVAVAKFQAGQYDLVFMDMQMPVLDGYQATEAMRRWEQEHRHAPTPIVALTANAFKEELDKSLASGCTAHLTKPIKKQVLLNAILEHTRRPADQAA
jgi:CheY-like chemotaxis protein